MKKIFGAIFLVMCLFAVAFSFEKPISGKVFIYSDTALRPAPLPLTVSVYNEYREPLYRSFPGTDSLRAYNNIWITNNSSLAFTNYRLHTLLEGMIDWIDSARLGLGGQPGVDSIAVVNDSTFRYRKNGTFHNVVIRGGVDQNNLTTGTSFNTGTGILTTTRSGLSSLTVDIDGRYVQTILRRSDSVFYTKDGVETFAFKDSTGGGGSLDTAAVSSIIHDSILAHPTLIVDTINYTHSGSELDTLTSATLIGKTIIFAGVHPFTLWLKNSYPPASDEVYVNTATGGIKFGTALQTGQTVTIIYKYLVTSGTPVVEAVQVNGGSLQTGVVPLTIPSQFNPIAGTNMSLSGTYPNITFNALGGSGSPKAGKSIRISGSDTVNNRVDVSDSSYAVLAGVLRGTYDTTTSQNTWAWIANSDHGNINIKDSVVTTGTSVQIFYDSSTYQKVVTFLIVPDETASRIAQSTASFQGKAGALFWSNGGYTAGASVALTSATISFSDIRGLSVQVVWNGSAWVMTNVGQNAINFNSTSPTISYSAGRLRIQNLPFNMKEFPDVMGYAPSGVDSLIGYQPSVEVISSTWVDIYFWDSKNNVKYTAATPPTNFGVYVNFGSTFALCNPLTEDMGFNSNWWVIAVMKKTLSMNWIFALALFGAMLRRKKYLMGLIFLSPLISESQIINRSKSFGNSGTSGIYQYSGTTAQRPTGDFRWWRWNTDSARPEIKINSTTWRGLLFNGEASGGGGGITSLNSLTGATQTFATGTSGTDFGISSSSTTHTFNIPTASASNRGLLSTTDWSAFNGKLSASDTVGKWWGLNGNTLGATKNFGSLDNNHIQFIANGAIVGGLASNGEFRFGTNTDRGAYPVQLNGRTIVFSPAGNAEFQVEDDGANSSNATSVFNISSNSLPNMLLTTPSNVNTLLIRDYGQTTNLFTIGADNNVALTHLLTDNATTGKKWAYGAINTFNPTSGGANRDAFLDSTTVNQTSGANGPYNSFHSILTKTSCANCGGVWIENTDSWFGTTSGRVGIGITRVTAPTAFLHLAASTTSAASLRLPSGTAPSSPNEGDIFNVSSFPKFYNGSATRRFALHNDASPSNGQLPIGNGTDFTLANITSTGGTVTVTNEAGTINIDIPASASSSGNYTATLTNGTNVASSSFLSAHYYRTGSHVTVYIKISIDPTGVGATDLGISLPVASNFTAGGQLIGLGNCTSIAAQAGTLDSDTTNDRANFVYTATDINSQVFYISFSYEIL